MKRSRLLYIILGFAALMAILTFRSSFFTSLTQPKKPKPWFSAAIQSLKNSRQEIPAPSSEHTDSPEIESTSNYNSDFKDLESSSAVNPEKTGLVNRSSDSKGLSENLTADMTVDTEAKQEELCWNKIQSEITTEDFLEYNKDYLNQRIGSWIYTNEPLAKDYQPQTLGAKFYLALGRADLLIGDRKVDLDLKQSRDLLYESIAADPTNSAPIMFAALLEQKLGNIDAKKALIKKAKSTTHFNSYMSETLRGVYSRVRSSADYLQAISIWSTVPIPNYKELKNLLIENSLTNIAEQMITPALNESNVMPDLDWSVVEYAIGKRVLQKLDPSRILPERFTVASSKKKDEMLDGTKMLTTMRQSCTLASMDPFTKKIQEYTQERGY